MQKKKKHDVVPIVNFVDGTLAVMIERGGRVEVVEDLEVDWLDGRALIHTGDRNFLACLDDEDLRELRRLVDVEMRERTVQVVASE